jgi:hypothetical protein
VLYSPFRINLVWLTRWRAARPANGLVEVFTYIIHVTCSHRISSLEPGPNQTKQPPSSSLQPPPAGLYSVTMSTPSSSTPQPTSSQQAPSAAATPQFVAYPLAPGQQPQLPPQASSSTEGRTPPQTRLPSAETRKDRSLVDFLLMLDDYEPLVCIFATLSGARFPIAMV